VIAGLDATDLGAGHAPLGIDLCIIFQTNDLADIEIAKS
jgi:hypothetical protein